MCEYSYASTVLARVLSEFCRVESTKPHKSSGLRACIRNVRNKCESVWNLSLSVFLLSRLPVHAQPQTCHRTDVLCRGIQYANLRTKYQNCERIDIRNSIVLRPKAKGLRMQHLPWVHATQKKTASGVEVREFELTSGGRVIAGHLSLQ